MKLALFSSPRCIDPQNGSGGHHWAHRGLYGAFLRQFKTVYFRWRVKSEMDSFFQVAESMGLDPMKNPLPPFLLQKLHRTHEIMHALRGINFPLTPHQQQPTKQP